MRTYVSSNNFLKVLRLVTNTDFFVRLIWSLYLFTQYISHRKEFIMKIVFVRHGEPDYINDSLTEKGWREAKLLANRICKWNVTDFYCSPLGRAKDTASCTLEKMNRTAVTLEWMKEFAYEIDDPITGKHGVPWDFVPSYWTNDPLLMDADRWVESDIMQQNPEIAIQYKNVCQNFDKDDLFDNV